MRTIHYLCLLLVIGALLSGCVSDISTDTGSNTPVVAQPTTTTVPAATVTVTPTPTKTQVPSPTAIQSTSTDTPLPTKTATLTPPQTMEPEQAEETLRTLLQEPVDCPAPCYWGITPGQTTLGEAINIITRLGLRLEHTYTQNDQKFYATNYTLKSGLSISFLLVVQDALVESIDVSISPEKHESGVPREWLAYSPETLIARYGPPSKVGFFIGDFPSEAGTIEYYMILYFNTVDLIIKYSYGVITLGPRMQTCPLTDHFENVRVWLGKNPDHPPLEGIPLEEATLLTIKEFSGLMTSDPEEACFDLIQEAFREP